MLESLDCTNKLNTAYSNFLKSISDLLKMINPDYSVSPGYLIPKASSIYGTNYSPDLAIYNPNSGSG